MILTLFGLVAVAINLLMMVFKRPLREFFILVTVSGVFGAAEAVALPMLGGASLTVPTLCVALVLVRVLLAAKQRPWLLAEAFGANIWIFLLAMYGLAAAFIMPKLFEGTMSVFTLRDIHRSLLTFSTQNITQSAYLMLTAISTLAGYMTARSTKSDSALITGWVVATIAFITFALVDLAGFYGGGLNLMEWARTASYSMLNQSDSGLKRISGSFAEPSAFASFGAAPLALFSCFWLVDVRSTLSGALAVAVAIVMALSTSSTAFVMLGIVFVIVIAGVVSLPMTVEVRQRKFIALFLAVFAGILGCVALAFFSPKFVNTFLEVLETATIGKAKSVSAIERAGLAAQGFEAFRISNGFGIGPGSFKSSGLAQAIIGSTGIFGSICFLFYLLKIMAAPLRKTPFADRRVVVACAIASVLILGPNFMVSGNPDPGVLFGTLAGFTLGRLKAAQMESKAHRAMLADERNAAADGARRGAAF